MARVRNQANRACQSGRTLQDLTAQRQRYSDHGTAGIVARACDRFLLSRGLATGSGMRDLITTSAQSTLRKKRARRPTSTAVERLAEELERGWAT